MIIRSVGAELLHADGRTGGRTDRQTDRHDEANIRFFAILRKRLKRLKFLRTERIHGFRMVRSTNSYYVPKKHQPISFVM
jgi:hypothetical protein